MNVLFIGNGFDLAHGLNTHYDDFLPLMKSPDFFINAVKEMKMGRKVQPMWEKYYFSNISQVNIQNLEKMADILKNNTWAKYFIECGATIQGWIDFEKELLPAIRVFRVLFDMESSASIIKSGFDNIACLTVEDEELLRKARLLSKYVFIKDDNIVQIKGKRYVDSNYGIVKNNILKDLKQELDDFVEAFRIYLQEMVCKVKITLNSDIKDIQADAIISFNYTKTELQYDNLREAIIYNVHGSVEKENSIIIGVEEIPDDINNYFIYFVKYFQRIRKRIDYGYKNLIGEIGRDKVNVFFYGHSLNMTDSDIIKQVIEEAEHVTVYHYGENDYEQKIINLINMFDRNKIEEDLFNKRIEFLDTMNKS